MFEKIKAHHAEFKAEQARIEARTEKQREAGERASEMAELRSLLALAHGQGLDDVDAVVLKKGEIAVAQIAKVSLIEERRSAGHYVGGSQGVSFPIGHVGRSSIRYHVGATRGHYVQGESISTAVDHGTLTITNQRFIYLGQKKSVECQFAKLLGIQHGDGGLTISVSNRQKATQVFFGKKLDDWVAIRLHIALALFEGEADAVAADFQVELDELQKVEDEAAAS